MNDPFEFYDFYFFSGLLKAQADFSNLKYNFIVGSGTRSAGTCSLKGGLVNITLSKPIFDAITPDKVGTLSANGIVIGNRLHAIMIVFEHELLHSGFETANGCTDEKHGPNFKKMAASLFQHLSTTHSLLPTSIKGDKVYILSDFKADDKIMINLKGVPTPATVIKTNKTLMRVIINDHTNAKYDINSVIVISK